MSGDTQISSPGPTGARPSLRSALAPVTALLISVALLLMGNGLQGTLLPIRGNIEQFANVELGLLGTGYFLGFTLGCVFGPILLLKGGHIRTFMAMASLASVIVLLHTVYVEPIIWGILRATTGFCFAVLYVVIESWINEKSNNQNRGKIFSVYTVINLTVVTIGQMMIALDDPAIFSLFALASILISLATLPLAFTSSAAPVAPEFVLPNLKELYVLSPVGFAGCLAVGLASGAFWTLGPIFAQGQGLDIPKVGLFMSAVVVGGALAQWPMGHLSDRMDRRYMIIASSIIGSVAGIGFTVLAGAGGATLFVLGALFGAGAFPIYSLAVAHANDHAKPLDMVKISSGLLLVYGVGAAFGPLIASAISNLSPMPTLFIYTTVVHTLLIGFVAWRIRKRPPAVDEERVSFDESIINAQTVSQVATQTALAASESDGNNNGKEN